MIIYDFATPYSYYPPLFLSCLPPSPFLSFSFLSLSLFSRSLSSPVLSSRLFLFASALGSSSSIRPLLTLFLPSVTNCCCIIGVFPVVVLTYPHRAKYNLGSLPAREPEKRLPHLRKALSKSPRVSCGLRPTRFPSFPSSPEVFFLLPMQPPPSPPCVTPFLRYRSSLPFPLLSLLIHLPFAPPPERTGD